MIAGIHARWVLLSRGGKSVVLGLVLLGLVLVLPAWAYIVFPLVFLALFFGGMVSAAVEIFRERRQPAGKRVML